MFYVNMKHWQRTLLQRHGSVTLYIHMKNWPIIQIKEKFEKLSYDNICVGSIQYLGMEIVLHVMRI